MSSFTIDKVGWHTSVKGNTESVEKIHGRFRSIATFLQREKLTVRPLLLETQPINDDFAIKSDDLTEEGLMLMKKKYDKWLQGVDQGKSYSDVSTFIKELKRMRNK